MKKKFADSYVTSVRCERSIIALAEAMGITLERGLKKGVLLEAEFKLTDAPNIYSAEVHELFLALQKKDLEEFTEWLNEQRFKEGKIAALIELKKTEEAKQGEKIRYYDIEEGYVMLSKEEAARRDELRKAMS